MCVFCYYSPTIPAPFCISSLAIHGVTIHPARLDIFLFTSLAQALAVAFCRLSWGLTFLPSSPPVASTILNVNLMMLPLVYKPLTAARARRMRSLSFPWHCSSWHCLPPGLLLHFPLCALLTWPALFHATSQGNWGRSVHTIAPQLAFSALLCKHALILIQRLIPIVICVIICANVYLLSASCSGEQRLMLSYSLTYPWSLAQGLAHANVSASTCGVRSVKGSSA